MIGRKDGEYSSLIFCGVLMKIILEVFVNRIIDGNFIKFTQTMEEHLLIFFLKIFTTNSQSVIKLEFEGGIDPIIFQRCEVRAITLYLFVVVRVVPDK